MAPGIFRPELTLPTRGLKYGFQGTIYAKNLQKFAFRLTTGASKLRRGGYSPLALNGTTSEHIEVGGFDCPQICQPIRDAEVENSMNELELKEWRLLTNF